MLRTTNLLMMLIVITGCAWSPVPVSTEGWQSTRVIDRDLYCKGSNDGVRHKAEFVLHELDLQEGDVVVDIGAGDGWWVERMAERVGENGLVYAAEIKESLVDEMKEDFADRPEIKPYLVESDSTGLEDSTCDLAIFVRVYHHLDEGGRVDYLRHLCHVVKPTGRLVVIDQHPDVPPDNGSHTMAPYRLFEHADEAGWIPVRYEQLIGATHYMAIFVPKDLFSPPD